MKNFKILKIQVLIFLLSWVAPVSYASSFYAEDFKIPAGGSANLSLMLDNDQNFVGFQFDLVLSEGLIVFSSGNAIECSLASRTDDTYSLFSNILSDGKTVRIGAFSAQNTPISGNSGELLSVLLGSYNTFAEGVVQIKNIRFVDVNNHDVILPDVEVNVAREHVLVEQLVLNQTTLTLTEGQTALLSVNVLPENASTKDVVWKSSSEDVAVVSATGEVEALKAGNATITCTAADGSGVITACEVTVTAVPVSSINIIPSQVLLKVSETAQLVASVLPENASNKGLSWNSCDASVATVDMSGRVTALSLGEAIIKATATDGSGVSATCVITVSATQAEGVSITAEGQTTLKVGGTVQLRARVIPEAATDKSVTWRSSDDKIATVTTEGLVAAVGVGTATITCANSAGQTAMVKITVEPTFVSSITLNLTAVTLNESGTLQLEAAVQPDNAADKTVVWTSSNEAVATVDESGVVTAIGTGSAEITVTANDGSGQSATCVVTVKDSVVITWSQEFEAVVGDVVRLHANASNGGQVMFRVIIPDGGYVSPEIDNENGMWTATFANTGAVILEAYIDNPDESTKCEPVRKVFNVLPDRDVLLIDGIYYRYIDGTKTALTVTYGYRQYEGDVVVPPLAGGLPVVSVDNRAFYSNAGLMSVMLPEGLERIESDQAFGNCPLLSDVTLPSTLTHIGSYAFNAGGGLQEIHCGMEHPLDVEISNIFNGFVDYDNCILYVPYGCADEYREAEVWKNFKNIVEEEQRPVLVALLALDVDDITLTVDETETLIAKIYPSNAGNQMLEWTSSDETVVVVSEGGEIMAVGEGTAMVTAATTDGSGLTTSCTVYVKKLSGIGIVGYESVRVITANRQIVVIGLSANDEISLYDMSGELVYKGTDKAVDVPQVGFYIIGIKGIFYKIVVRG